eukprot:Colp12_sorted_trinity150504_noHs@9607
MEKAEVIVETLGIDRLKSAGNKAEQRMVEDESNGNGIQGGDDTHSDVASNIVPGEASESEDESLHALSSNSLTSSKPSGAQNDSRSILQSVVDINQLLIKCNTTTRKCIVENRRATAHFTSRRLQNVKEQTLLIRNIIQDTLFDVQTANTKLKTLSDKVDVLTSYTFLPSPSFPTLTKTEVN